MMLLDRVPTAYDDKIYSAGSRCWRDPEIPDWTDPLEILLGRHRGTRAEDKPAIIADAPARSLSRSVSSISCLAPR
jgi:hypothetical protein